jgi:hypothetical protein
MKNSNTKKRVSIAGLIGVILMSVLLVLSACSQDSNLFGHKKTEEPSRGNFFGWFEYEPADKDIQIVRAMYYGMPNYDKLRDAFEFHGVFNPSHTPDGSFRAYHYQGPFKAVLAVKTNMKMGRLNGTTTFWNEHGIIFKQQVFQEDLLVESRYKAPWLDNETDQTLPDGVYTFFEGEDFRSLSHANYPTVGRQEIYKVGQKVETITTNGEWRSIEEGFWKCVTGLVLCVPARSGCEWSLNRRKLSDGSRLLIQGYTDPVIFHVDMQSDNGRYPEYTDLQGRQLNTTFTTNAIFSWEKSVN